MSDTAPAPTSSRRRTAPLVAGLVALVAGALVVILVAAGGPSGDTADTPLMGRPAPASSGELADGTPFELSRRKGSWVVLNFFAENCVPCVQEHPDLVEFDQQQARLGPEGAELYSVVQYGRSVAQVEAFFDERGGDWPVVYDPDVEFQRDFGVAQVPETWVIDPDGVVQARFIRTVTADELSQLLQTLRERRVA